ncbi:hypothetical protein JCM16408A_18630 [Methylobacterium phyllosphaerae]
MRRLSTAATSGLTGLPMAGKAGKGAGHRPIARWSNDQDPRTHRYPPPVRRPPADAGQRQRRNGRPSGAGRGARRIHRLSADKGYDADWLRTDLRRNGITPVIPGKRGRKRRIRHNRSRYRERRRIEAMFNRLKDFRRIATRYDKLARNYASAIALVAVLAF